MYCEFLADFLIPEYGGCFRIKVHQRYCFPDIFFRHADFVGEGVYGVDVVTGFLVY